jgi:exopolyphosphatase/guanosine-5'-triphosphate,3'-diphosphate pyrophosphatase
MAGWTSSATASLGKGSEGLRLVATMLSMAQARLEPNMRLKHSFDWAMDKRWTGIDHRGRALVGAALRGACGKPEPTADLLRLATVEDLRVAAGWGLAFRLCRRIGAGSRASMLTSRLLREDNTLVLWLDPSRAQLASDSVTSDIKTLAEWIGCTPELRIGKRELAGV